jgi:hypothetical protein
MIVFSMLSNTGLTALEKKLQTTHSADPPLSGRVERLPSETTLFNPNEKDQMMNNVRKYLRWNLHLGHSISLT